MRLIDADALSELVKEPIDVFLSRLDLKCPPIIDLEPHWIPCSERLPEDGQIVLAWVEWGAYRVMKRDDEMWRDECDKEYYFWEEQSSEMLSYKKDYVIAWMPLPAPYGGE